MVLAVSSCLFCLLAAPPTQLSDGFGQWFKAGCPSLVKCFISLSTHSLKWFSRCPRAPRRGGLPSRYVTHLFVDQVTQTRVHPAAEIFTSLKWFGIRFIRGSCVCCWPRRFFVSGRWSSQAGNHYLQFSPRTRMSLSHDLFVPHRRTKHPSAFYSNVKVLSLCSIYALCVLSLFNLFPFFAFFVSFVRFSRLSRLSAVNSSSPEKTLFVLAII